MDKRIIILIVSLLAAVAAFVVYRIFFSSKEKIQVNYVIKNIKNNLAQKDSTIMFADQTAEATEWKWNFGDDQYSFDKEPTHIYNSVGSYRVRLTVTTAKGTETDTSKVIKVVELNPVVAPPAPVVHQDTIVKPKPVTPVTPVQPAPKPVVAEQKQSPKPKVIKPQVKQQSKQSHGDDKIYDLNDQSFKK